MFCIRQVNILPSNSFKLSSYSKNLNIEPSSGPVDLGEGIRNSYVNRLASLYRRQYTSVINSGSDFRGLEHGVFGIVIIDFISIFALVGFILLHANYDLNSKGAVFYV